MKIAVKLAIFIIIILAQLISQSLITSAAPTVIDFEDLSTTGRGTGNQVTVLSQYNEKGVTFKWPGPKAIDYSKGDRRDLYQNFAHSGTKGIEQCYSEEFCQKFIQIDFNSPQKRVKVWVGYSGILDIQKTVTLSAFDQTGAQVGQTTAVLQPSTTPIPIRTSIEVRSDSENIYSAIVKFAPDSNGRSFSNGLAVDDIEFDTLGPGLKCISTRNPLVTLMQPRSGQTLRFNNFDVVGTVDTTGPLEEAKIIITGPSGSSKSLDLFYSGFFSPTGGPFKVYGITDMLFFGSNTITVRARDCKGSGESSTTLIFQPCDSTAIPVVTITEPEPSTNPSPASVVASDSFKLKGKIDSKANLDRVIVTVSGLGYDTHEFDINPNEEGVFDEEVSSDNLFKGINTITIRAQNSLGCSGQASTTVGYDKRIKKRISGESFLLFDAEDSGDKYRAENGFLYVTHDPGCGWEGNSGVDRFFSHLKLPLGYHLVNVEFKQFWPKERGHDDCGVGAWFGGGSYLTDMELDPDQTVPGYTLGDPWSKSPPVGINWENACCGEYGGKNIEYVVSFIIAVSEGLVKTNTLGEPMFDPDQLDISSIQPPEGYAETEQPAPATPPKTEPEPPTPSVKSFYFKLIDPESWVNPCDTIEVFAPDEATAKALAQAQCTNCEIESIDYQQYIKGC